MLLLSNGDIFVADTDGGVVRVLRGIRAEGKPRESSVYTNKLCLPYGPDSTSMIRLRNALPANATRGRISAGS
jgi:hypothetical protein